MLAAWITNKQQTDRQHHSCLTITFTLPGQTLPDLLIVAQAQFIL